MKTAGEARLVPFVEAITERLQVGLTTGNALDKSGALKVVRIGSRRYVTEAELQRFIAKQQRDSAAKQAAAERRVQAAKKAAAESVRVRREQAEERRRSEAVAA